jgi:hypothetical protein
MRTGVMFSGSQVSKRLPALNGKRFAWQQPDFTKVKRFAGGFAAGFAVMDAVFESEGFCFSALIVYSNFKRQVFASKHLFADLKRSQYNVVLGGIKPKQGKCFRMSLFKEATAGMSHYPIRIDMLAHPTARGVEYQRRVVFADVIEAIGYRAAYGFCRVLFQVFKYG